MLLLWRIEPPEQAGVSACEQPGEQGSSQLPLACADTVPAQRKNAAVKRPKACFIVLPSLLMAVRICREIGGSSSLFHDSIKA